MNKRILIILLLFCNFLVAQKNPKFRPTKDYSLDSIKINGYSWKKWDNYKFFYKYKASVKAEDCINDTTLSDWESLENFKTTKDTATEYYIAQKISIPQKLINFPIFRGMPHNVQKIWQNGILVYDFTFDKNKIDKTVSSLPFSFSIEHNIIVYQIHNPDRKRRVITWFSGEFESYFSFITRLLEDHANNMTLGTLSSFLFAVSLMLFFIYSFGMRERKYIWGTAFIFGLALSLFSFTKSISIFDSEIIGILLILTSPYFLVHFIYALYNYKLPKWVKRTLLFLSITLMCFVILILLEIDFINNILYKDDTALSLLIPTGFLFTLSTVFVFIGVFRAIRQRLVNSLILSFGLLTLVLLTLLFFVCALFTDIQFTDKNWYKVVQILPMPMCVLITVVRDYVSANKNLKTQLVKVEDLTAQTIKEQEEKQQILASQNEKLELQVAERTKEINDQKHILQEKQKEITDSINYARRLQQAILPSTKFISKNFPNSFLLYKPKDIVAGDFYWAEQINDLFFIAAADSTGHGVPGAMVSVVCSNALNRTIKEFKLTETGKILDKTRELVLETFEKSASEVKDGMDISLLCIDSKNKNIFWSGANNPLWYIQDAELKEIKADKQPIGKTDYPKPFTTHQIEYKENTTFYLFTDGFADQFGGPNGKKFKYKQFSDLLVKSNHLSQKQQADIIERAFSDWKGDLEQVDDVCVIGIKL